MQAKIESLTEQKVAAQERVQRLKYAAGSEPQPAAGQAGDSAERNKLERQRHKHERLARVMIAVKALYPNPNPSPSPNPNPNPTPDPNPNPKPELHPTGRRPPSGASPISRPSCRRDTPEM